MISPVMIWEFGNGVAVESNGYQLIMKVLSFLEKKDEDNCYLVWKRYYFLNASPDVKRMIIVVEG